MVNCANRVSRRGCSGAVLMDDVMFAVRSAMWHGVFFVFVVLILGFGVGAMTAMYSAIKVVVLESSAYAGGERVVKMWRIHGSGVRLILIRE